MNRSHHVQISRRDLMRGGAALGLSAAAPRSGVRAQADPATLTIAVDGSPSDLDPHSGYDYRSTMAIRGPYEGLIGLKDDKTDQYVGLIAESWEPNEDKSVWTFHLRPGVTFQDGSPCDAEAVRASYERFLTMGIGPVNVVSRFVPDPAQITAPDPATVVFDLGRPQPFFEAAMAATYGPQVVNVKVMKEHEEDGDWGNFWAQTNAEGTGTGPYRITEYEPDQILVMEKYDGYWGGWDGAHFDRIVIRTVEEDATRRQLIEQGEVDIIDTLTYEAITELQAHPDLVVDSKPATRVSYFYMAIAGALETPAARQAMCYAFPYDETVNGAFLGFGKQAVGPVADTIRGFDPDTFTYPTDLTKAKELLGTAGVEEGTELSMIIEPGDEVVRTISQLFQANLAEIGLTLSIEEVSTASYTDILYGDAPAAERPNFMSWSWWPDYNDAWNHLYPQVSCEQQGSNGSNAGMYCNERVEELLAAAKDAPDEATYQQALSELQQILSRDDPPAIYYIQPDWITILRTDIQGFVLNPINLGTYEFHRMSRTT